jgi:hypothetical protein
VYAYFFKSTPFNKAVLCFGATALAVTGSILNYDKLFTDPFGKGTMTEFTKSYFANYILTDFIAMCEKLFYERTSTQGHCFSSHIFLFINNIF